MSQPEMAEKHKNPATQGGGSSPFAGSIRECLAAVGLEILWPRSSDGGAPPFPACVQ